MKKLVVLGIVLMVIGGVMCLGKAPYRNWKQKRYVTQAEQDLSKGNFSDAVVCARNTLDINPSNVTACQILAVVAEQLRSPEAITWRQKVVELQPNSVTNRLTLARTALQFGDTKEAGQALDSITAADRNLAVYHELAALLDLARTNNVGAETEAALAVKLDPKDKSLQLNLAILDVQSKDPRLVQAGKNSLLALTTDPPMRQRALRQLAQTALRESDSAQAEAYGNQLLAEDPPVLDDEVFFLEILKAGKSKKFASSLAAVESQVAKNPQFIQVFTQWMIQQNLADEALRWMLDFPAATQQLQPVSVAIVDCLMAGHDWAKMQTFLSNENWDENEYLRLALMARAQREQQNEAAAQANWHAALTAAQGQEQSLASLMKLANSWKWDKEQVEAAWQLSDRYPDETSALKLLEFYYQAHGDTADLQKVFARQMKLNPSDAEAKNNFAACLLLLGVDLPKAQQMAGENYKQAPQNPYAASTYAFSLYRNGQAQEALQVMEKMPADFLRQPAFAVYYGAELVSAGQPAKARDYLAIASQGQSKLLPEEKALLGSAQAAFPVQVK